jgi:hypothetical protein
MPRQKIHTGVKSGVSPEVQVTTQTETSISQAAFTTTVGQRPAQLHPIALQLAEDFYGGRLTEEQIFHRLVTRIHAGNGHGHHRMPVFDVAHLIMEIWKSMDERLFEAYLESIQG